MSRRRGTTLITLIVSIAILGVALATAASVFVSASKLTKHAANMASASSFAESVMEHVRSQPFGSIRSVDVTRGLPKLPGVRCAVAVRSPESGLKEITVTCSWAEGDNPYSVRYSTLAAGGQRQ
jgi:type II secretory pathway pseudopilin PulG